MKDIEEMLKANKINNLSVPDELGARLRTALEKKKLKKGRPLGLIAAAAIVFMVFAYNFDAIAYYTNRILGFDTIVSGTLSDLNKIGKGQVVNKSFTMDNGVTVVLDGVMVDGNQLIAFFTATRGGQEVGFDDFNLASLRLNGLMRRYFGRGGVSKYNEDKTEIRHVYKFDPPSPWERDLTFSYSYISNGATQVEKIRFRLQRRYAMGFVLTENIKQTIELGKGRIVRFDTIRVSPTKTVIDGTLVGPPSPATGSLPQLEIELVADGKVVDPQGFSSVTKVNKREEKFSLSFDTVPPATKQLEVKVVGMTESFNIDREIEIRPGKNAMDEHPLTLVGDARITVKDFAIIGETSTVYFLTSGKYPIIERAYLVSPGQKLPLAHIGSGGFDSRNQGQISALWTLNFTGNIGSGPYTLEITVVRVAKPLDKSITLQLR